MQIKKKLTFKKKDGWIRYGLGWYGKKRKNKDMGRKTG